MIVLTRGLQWIIRTCVVNLNVAKGGGKLVMHKAVSRAVIFIDTGASSRRACNVMTSLFCLR